MTLTELGYMILEAFRANFIVDDERLDIRLIHDWINLKRAEFIKKNRTNNPNGRLDLNLYQLQTVVVDVIDVTDAGDYPYSNMRTQLYEIVESTTTIPTIIEDKTGPIIYSLESEDLMKLPFAVVDYDHLRFAGNGKFNRNLIFGAIRDNKIYFKYNEQFDDYTTVKLRAVFEDPRQVTGYDNDTSRYPLNLELLEYVKNAIYDRDLRMILGTKADEVSDGDGEIKT